MPTSCREVLVPRSFLFTPGNKIITTGSPLSARWRHRRIWVSDERAHVEVRGLEQPDGDRVAAAIRARLERLDNISWVCAPGPLGRVVVTAENGVLDTEAVLCALAEVEQAYGVHRQPFPIGYPEHPGDLQPLQREIFALAADVAAVGFTVVGRLAQFTPVPVEVVSFGSIIDSVPRLRSLLARLVGWPVTEITLATTNAVSAGLAQGAFGLVVDIAHRWGQLGEHRARRQVWVQREAQLCATPVQPQQPRQPIPDRPVPLPPGPVERAGDWFMITSFGAAGAMLAATSNPRSASGLLLAGLPRAARLGREAFAAQTGRALAARGVLVLDPAVLRRLDRLTTVIVDSDVMRTTKSRLDEFAVLADVRGTTLARRAHALFDPDDPQRPQEQGSWRLCPTGSLDVALPQEAQAQIRDLSTGGRQVLGITRDGDLMGFVAVIPEIDPEVELLVEEARRAGHELLVAGHAPTAGVPTFDGAVAGGSHLADEVRRLQSEGKVVAVVSARNGTALRAADCGIGITREPQAVPWDADLLCTDQLQDASFCLQATVVAREVSRRSTLLAVGGSVLGGPLALIPSPQAGRRALILVNGAALTAVASGAWAGLNLSWQPRRPAVTTTPWHALPADAVLQALDSSLEGLTDEEAQRRLAARGDDEGTVPAGLGSAVAAELETPLTPVLAAGAGLSAAVGGLIDAAMVATVLGINALVGGVQRVQTNRILAGLVNSVRTPVRVLRGGQERQVSSEDLAPGDIVRLQSGDVIPADCRVLEPVALEVDESSLTGESLPVRKRAKATPAAAVADRRSMVYEGTTVAAGEATAVVVATGSATEAGRALAGAQGQSPNGVEQRLSSLTKQTIPLSLAGGGSRGDSWSPPPPTYSRDPRYWCWPGRGGRSRGTADPCHRGAACSRPPPLRAGRAGP
jgi:cation-transporting P-type ATPase I